MSGKKRMLRGRISDVRRAWSSMTAKEAHRRAVLLLLRDPGRRASASAEDLDRYCFRALADVPWCQDSTVELLVEMELDGEIAIDWQQTLDDREVISWIWLKAPQPKHPIDVTPWAIIGAKP
jgi:hypothetical protein